MSAESSWGLSNCNPMPIARMRAVYRLDEVEKRGERFQLKPLGLSAMEHLYDELPNFHPVLDEVRRPLALCAMRWTAAAPHGPAGQGPGADPAGHAGAAAGVVGGEAGGRRGSTCRSRLISGTLGQSAQDALRRDAPQKVTQRFAGLVMEGGTGALHQGPFPDAVEAKAAEVRARLTPGGQRPLLAPEEAGQRPHGAP